MGTPVAGDLDLRYQTLIVPGSAGLTLVTYLAEPGSPAAERLVLLASWAALTATCRARATRPRAFPARPGRNPPERLFPAGKCFAR